LRPRGSDLRYGRLVWATLTDRNGVRAEHPGIIITPDDEIEDDQEVDVVAVTTSYPEPAPPFHVPLPWNPDRRRVGTGLARRSAAVANWLNVVHPSDIRRFAGDVSPKLMAKIQEELAAWERQV
jgi:mRNA-degrading endonuclease toxin of MazEF toxin-antitoxin module